MTATARTPTAPAAMRAGVTTIAWTTAPSPLGPLLLAATPQGLCGLLFDPPEEGLPWLRRRLGPGSEAVALDEDPAVDVPASPDLAGPAEVAAPAAAAAHLAAALRQLAEYFAGRRRAFELALDLRGTAFERAVWSTLRAIPYGATRSYGEVAAAAGRPGAARAVGLANHRNPVAVVVPCHRVIGRDGRLVGYGGGLERKAWLLAHERGMLAHERGMVETHA